MRRLGPVVAVVTAVLALASVVYAKDPAAKKERKKPDPEKVFAQKDKDGDGSISLQEYIGKRKDAAADKAKAMFEKLDTDGSGGLSKQELTAPPKRAGKGKKKAAE